MKNYRKILIILSTFVSVNMNIFFLSMSIRRCAKYHFDKHVVKMILEYCQLLSTAWFMLEPEISPDFYEQGLLYRKTHYNHPSAVWVRQHINNYMYVVNLALELCKEWRYRYGHGDNRLHASEERLIFLSKNPPYSIEKYDIPKTRSNPKSLTVPLPKAMPIECKTKKETVHGAVRAYRRYYKSEHKSHIVSWTVKNRNIRIELPQPPWW